jgi:hypothetical protein
MLGYTIHAWAHHSLAEFAVEDANDFSKNIRFMSVIYC